MSGLKQFKKFLKFNKLNKFIKLHKLNKKHLKPILMVWVAALILLGVGILACRPTEDRDPASLMDDYFNYYNNNYNNGNNNNDQNNNNNENQNENNDPENPGVLDPTPTPEPTATPEPTEAPEPTLPAVGITDFAGITSVSEVSDTTALLGWNFHEDAAYYVIFKKELAPVAEEKYKVVAYLGNDQTSYLVKGLSINTSYSFKMHAYNQVDVIDSNTVTQTVQTTLAPRVPVSVMLTFPVSSPGFSYEATFTVRYVKPGETIKIFKDSSCTQQLGSGVVEADKTSIAINASGLESGMTYNVYANATNIYGHTSACSSAYATYQVAGCPDDSYVRVEANEDYGTEAFCVMKTEAKKVNNLPTSQYAGAPWGKITGANAKAACRNLTWEHGTCDLISNAEWMVIARDIEATAANWSGGVVGEGTLNRGHSDNSPASALAISDPTDDWSDTGNDNSTWTQKRTHVLSNGAVIWDLSGNLQEIVDWTLGGDTIGIGPTTCSGTSTEPLEVNCAALNDLDYRPANPADIAANLYTAQSVGVGRFFGTTAANASKGAGLAGRGENYSKDFKAGIFSLSFNLLVSGSDATIGFRCVCRPN